MTTTPGSTPVAGAGALLVRALQFGDSVFPVGGFAFSGGLESAIQKRVVTDTASLEAFTRTALEQAALGDGIAIVAAHHAAKTGDVDALARIDRQVYARKLSSEMRTMTVRMGKKFAEMGAEVIGAPLLAAWRAKINTGDTPGCYPVSLAVNFAAQALPARDAFVVHQYGVASMILSAALRLMKISHVDTQRILYRLDAGADAAYEAAAAARLEDMAGFAPLTEILAAVHVKAHVRLFMN
ncbi:MAG TPA: urease accessory protein UreF [Burkholderiaceae bacterium]|jgi:urease accessory protein|nr:urease accessory protein UreF [Burkholderiaceae bacterium]HPE02535.1 urease accessory protein UreF [Burkholderiaceae bacterium]